MTACSNSQSKVGEFFQTDNATHIKRDYEQIIGFLALYKTKLDARNPNNYDKNNASYIEEEFKNFSNNFFITYNGKYIENYNDYLRIAIDESNNVENRNDFLILGLYKYVWTAYKLNDSHQITTLYYDVELLKSLYYSLSVLRWEIRTKKDKDDNYLFTTWQNNWQIELEKRIKKGEKPSWELIQELEYISKKRETIYSHSNFNFEILMDQMLSRIENSLRITGEEPLDIGIEAMKSLVLFL